MEFVKGVSTPKQANNGNLMLQVLATQTGGKVLYGTNNIAKMLNQCLADAQEFYVLTFNAPHAAHPDEYNGIQVQVNKSGLKVRTRTGFYAQP
jgi:VWFA-related protein